MWTLFSGLISPYKCLTKEWKNVAKVLHNTKREFPKDFFRHCPVHQYGRRDVTWKLRIAPSARTSELVIGTRFAFFLGAFAFFSNFPESISSNHMCTLIRLVVCYNELYLLSSELKVMICYSCLTGWRKCGTT